MGKRYQSILETVGNTPVVRINRLAPKGVNCTSRWKPSIRSAR